MSEILNKTIVLVLNRNWQAIHVRTPQEAFCMMATNVATVMEIDGEDHPSSVAPPHGVDRKSMLDRPPQQSTGEWALRRVDIRPVSWDEWITLPVRPQDNAVQTVRGAIRLPTVMVAVTFAKGPFKNKFRFCWRLFGLLARRERRAYPQRSVRSEQRSQQAKEPQPGGAGRRRAIGFVARLPAGRQVGHRPTLGGCSLLAPRIWPGGAPAKIGSYFSTNPKVPKKRPKLCAKTIRERDGNRCQYTGALLRPDEGSLDHVVPRSRGGKDAWENLVWSSKAVNAKKANRLPHEAGLKLLSVPRAPKELPVSALIRNAHGVAEWKLFLNE